MRLTNICRKTGSQRISAVPMRMVAEVGDVAVAVAVEDAEATRTDFLDLNHEYLFVFVLFG